MYIHLNNQYFDERFNRLVNGLTTEEMAELPLNITKSVHFIMKQHVIVMIIPYSGKLSREKTFADW